MLVCFPLLSFRHKTCNWAHIQMHHAKYNAKHGESILFKSAHSEGHTLRVDSLTWDGRVIIQDAYTVVSSPLALEDIF